jgi:hypothetical protein
MDLLVTDETKQRLEQNRFKGPGQIMILGHPFLVFFKNKIPYNLILVQK